MVSIQKISCATGQQSSQTVNFVAQLSDVSDIGVTFTVASY